MRLILRRFSKIEKKPDQPLQVTFYLEKCDDFVNVPLLKQGFS